MKTTTTTIRSIARRCAIVAVSALLSAAPLPAGDNGTLCTLAWDGLALGVAKERNVVAMYGQGFHDPNGGDTGARYFTDSKHAATLSFEFGIDRYITGVVYSRGLHPPRGAGKRAEETMPSSALDHLPHPYPVSLGMTKADVARLARVKAQSGDRWSFEVGGIGCDRSGSVELTFDKNGMLDKIELSIAPDE